MFNFQNVTTGSAYDTPQKKVFFTSSSNRFTLSKGTLDMLGYDHNNDEHKIQLHADVNAGVIALKLNTNGEGKRLSGKENNQFGHKESGEVFREIFGEEISTLSYVKVEEAEAGGYFVFNATGSISVSESEAEIVDTDASDIEVEEVAEEEQVATDF